MSFVTALGLAVALLVAAPTLAHLLRRGRAREQAFPPAGLVPEARATTRERSRLEDRGLLSLRALLIIGLSLLAAGPLVRCSRVSLGRSGGASVALALVIDDSASMRVRLPNGKTRFARALEAASELLGSAREGDAVAIVLAGKPARVMLAAGTDLAAARRALADLHGSDRSTDLTNALALGRASLTGLPHADKRVVLLSDLAGELPAESEAGVWAPLAELTEAVDDCGITEAAQSGRRITANVACSSEAAARGRALRLRAEATFPEVRLLARAGLQTVTLEAPAAYSGAVALTGADRNPDDDDGAVAPEGASLTLGVYADTSGEAVATGGPPLLEQALHALELGIPVKPFSELPREARELADVVALFIDDPAGLTPETRGALTDFLETGAVAALFTGEHAERVQLGSTLEPFLRGAVAWEPLGGQGGADPKSLSWLGVEALSLAELAARGRARLDSALLPDAEIMGTWNDGKPFVVRNARGRGALFTIGLPVAISESDFSLRPGFLALLDQIASEGLRRRGPRFSEAGSEWSFPSSLAVQIKGPSGPLALRDADGQRVATPDGVGHYELTLAGKRETRFVTLAASEILDKPQSRLPASWRGPESRAEPSVDATPELGWLLLLLLGLEVGVRALRLVKEQRAAVL